MLWIEIDKLTENKWKKKKIGKKPEIRKTVQKTEKGEGLRDWISQKVESEKYRGGKKKKEKEYNRVRNSDRMNRERGRECANEQLEGQTLR